MAWYDEAVFYHIYPLGLLGAPAENSYGEPEHRLRELSPWIDHIKEIGCNAIYIGPLFESVGHGYETTDYKKLDSRLGDNEDLKNFVAECHGKGIRVILDGVFNHTGRDFFAFKDLKEKREGSQYKDWYCNVNFWGNNEYNDGFSYENWGGYNLLVKLNQRNPAVRDYIEGVVRFWVKEFDIDGIRLDAADVLDFDFMKMLRWVAGEVKPDFWLMGEVIHGEYSRWVNEGTLHSVTNYALHKAFFSGHNDHNYFEIAHTIKRMNDMTGGHMDRLKLYNFVDNHDVERIYTKLNNKAHFAPVHVLLYTLPGIPSLYYGSEFGIEGRKEKFSDASLRPALNLNDFKDALSKNECTKLIARLGKVHKASKALCYGGYRELMLTNRQYAFMRSTDDDVAVVTVNNDDSDYVMTVECGGYPEFVGALTGQKVRAENGRICVNVKANSGEVWVPDRGDGTFQVEDAPIPSATMDEDKAAIEKAMKEAGNRMEAEESEETGSTAEGKETEAAKGAAEGEEAQAGEGANATEGRTAGVAATGEGSAEENGTGEAGNSEGGTGSSAETAGTEASGENHAKAAGAETAATGENVAEAAEIETGDTAAEVAETTATGGTVQNPESASDAEDAKYQEAFEKGRIAGLQEAILAIMEKNGYVTDQMRNDVYNNVYHDSLVTWVKSFR